ncbi:hypothetical protein [Pelosinus sp. sgz500959]|uniref:hypothetical protein n=1 Tax=Pelosinus sp. sgz500959 TaxID=3242472 RepID=UPI00366D94EF
MIKEVVCQCLENEIVKGTGLGIDATYTPTNTITKVSERIMKHLAKKVLENV